MFAYDRLCPAATVARPPNDETAARRGAAFSWRNGAGKTVSRLGDLEEAGGAHAAADAHRHDDVFCAPAFAFDQRVHGHARAADAVGVTD